MERTYPYPSKQVTAKLSDADYETLVDFYNQWFPDRTEVSFKETFSRMLAELKRLSLSASEAWKNSAEMEELSAANVKLADKNVELMDELNVTREQLRQAIEAVENKSVIPADHVLVHIEPALNYFLEICASTATRNLGREVTRAEILKNLFYEQIYSGPGDHLPLIWSKSEIRNIIAQYKRNNE